MCLIVMTHMPNTSPRHAPNRKNPIMALSVQTLLLGQNPKNDVTVDLIIFYPLTRRHVHRRIFSSHRVLSRYEWLSHVVVALHLIFDLI